MLDYGLYLLLIILIPGIGSVVGFFLGKKKESYRDMFNVLMTGAEFALVCYMFNPVRSLGTLEIYVPNIMGTGFDIKLDMFRYIFVWITSLIWFLATIYSTQYLINYKNRNRYYTFFMLTLSATLGVFMSENILNLFTFFEIMSFTSYVLIIHDQDKYALDAGRSYLGMAVAGSFILLMGIFIAYDYTGAITLTDMRESFSYLGDEKYFIAILLLIGFGVKASAFPFHVWLPKAHPAAPSPASAVLSGILIKTGIFGILIVCTYLLRGDEKISYLVSTVGLINMLLGGFLAMFQRNIKTILAYSSMSQAGYILFGIGLVGILKEDGYIALYGVLAHIFNHAVFKVLLFFIAGIIYMVLHELSTNIIKGFGKYKNVLKVMFIIGMLAITGIPGFNGYIGKTILHEALAEAHEMTHSSYFTLAEIIFTVSSGFTVAYLSKMFFSIFMYDNPKYQGQHKKFITKRALFPISVLCMIIIYVGLRPQGLLDIIGEGIGVLGYGGELETHFFEWHPISSSLQTIALGILIYIFFLRRYLLGRVDGEINYINPSKDWFNLERDLYKPILKGIYKGFSTIFHIVDNSLLGSAEKVGTHAGNILSREVSMMLPTSELPGDYESEEVGISITVRDLMERIRERVNSLAYSLFIFALILAVTLVLIIISYR